LRGTIGHRCEGWCGPHVRRHLEVLGGASRCLDTLREACPIPVGAWPATGAAVAGRDPLRANDVEQRHSQHRRKSNPNIVALRIVMPHGRYQCGDVEPVSGGLEDQRIEPLTGVEGVGNR